MPSRSHPPRSAATAAFALKPAGSWRAWLALLFLLSPLFTAAPSARAESAMRPKAGLWEHSTQMASQSGELEKAMQQAKAAMANLPPEQRQMMNQMMASRGMSVDLARQAVRVCLTPEQVARDQPPPLRDGCTQQSQRNGNVWSIQFNCPARKGEPGGSGQGTLTVQSPTAYDGDFTLTADMGGRREQLRLKTQGRWVGAECGQVRPEGG